MKYGPDRLVEELEALGVAPERREVAGAEFVIIANYRIAAGQFADRVIDLALQATPDFPRTVHSSIHVRSVPILYDLQNVPNVRNIVASPLGAEWRYWSHNFGWSGEGSNARRLLSQINGIFERA